MRAKTVGEVQGAFTLVELVVVIVLVGLIAVMLVPASAHIRPESQLMQCQNNLRQMQRAWKLYSEDNNGNIVSAYPSYGGFTGTWCGGNASTGGGAGTYTYSGADPAGIQAGLLWTYIKSLGFYHCPTDKRVGQSGSAPAQFVGKPILRSISMNGYMAGMSYGASPDWQITSPTGIRDPRHPVYLKESEMKQPQQTFVFIDEDQQSINDGMILVDVGGTGRLLDLPSRSHYYGYPISFVDGHVEYTKFLDAASKNWNVSDPNPKGGINDWMRLTNVTTHPL